MNESDTPPDQPVVLIVEDESIVAMDIQARLRQMGYSAPAVASTGIEAIERVQEFKPDLILMDINLKGDMDGIEAAAHIKEIRDIPVIYLTAYADDDTLNRAKVTSPAGYILKPFEERELQITIEMTLFRSQAEQSLRTSEARTSLLLDAIPDLMFELDNDGTVVNYRPPSIGRSMDADDELVGQTIDQLFPESAGDSIRRGLLAAIETDGIETVHYELPAGSETLHYEARLKALDQDRVLCITRDVTERRLYEQGLLTAKERAEEVSRLKDSILANMSHEIRTPMTAILGFSELLARRLEGSDLQKQADMIFSSGKRLLDLLNNIIDLARIEANKIELQNENHYVAETIDRVTGLLGILASNKGLELRVAVDKNLILDGDPRREEQILTNIVGNAIRYTRHGHVSITASREPQSEWGPDWAIIRVTDTGVGIDEEFLPFIFDEFRQESEGVDREFEGSGLGLAICKKLLDRMGGQIRVSSTKGKGTNVTIALPNAVRNQTGHYGPDQDSDRPAFSGGGPSLRILAVEDDKQCADLIAEVLGSDHNVTVVDSPSNAIDVANDTRFDVLVLDINLKDNELDGVQLLAELRDRPGLQQAPAIALTAYAMKGDKERFLENGFDYYLPKPFDPIELANLIANL